MPATEEKIKSKARELGFSGVGIARAERLDDESAHLREWLSRGYQGTMAWMTENTAKRIDPGEILPDARSIIAVAMNYYTDVSHPEKDGVGKISRYAWGDDYHDILQKRLRELSAWLEIEHPEARTRSYVDTGPVMDKVWAQRAGIGWEGKHTNVITQEMGSWVFLGEIITTIELEPDEPAMDHCGTCTLCLEACPTHAIVEPYVVDSNLCLSYLTIEHRGEIVGDVTDHFDGWIYGCDICQDVCPWNHKFARETEITGFQPREGNVAPHLDEWKDMDVAEFRSRFKGSPVKRTKLDGLIRNVRIVREVRKDTLK